MVLQTSRSYRVLVLLMNFSYSNRSCYNRSVKCPLNLANLRLLVILERIAYISKMVARGQIGMCCTVVMEEELRLWEI